jgi:hypothetical protein
VYQVNGRRALTDVAWGEAYRSSRTAQLTITVTTATASGVNRTLLRNVSPRPPHGVTVDAPKLRPVVQHTDPTRCSRLLHGRICPGYFPGVEPPAGFGKGTRVWYHLLHGLGHAWSVPSS